jgi:hypothetical protein
MSESCGDLMSDWKYRENPGKFSAKKANIPAEIKYPKHPEYGRVRCSMSRVRTGIDDADSSSEQYYPRSTKLTTSEITFN